MFRDKIAEIDADEKVDLLEAYQSMQFVKTEEGTLILQNLLRSQPDFYMHLGQASFTALKQTYSDVMQQALEQSHTKTRSR